MRFPSVNWHGQTISQNAWIVVLLFGWLIAFFRHDFTSEATDASHCRAITESGKWLVKDPELKNWQPSGCMLHHYNAKDAGKCLKEKRVLYVGDSTARQAFFGAVRAVNSSLEDGGTTEEKHMNQVRVLNDISYEFFWDPYMTKGGLDELKKATAENSNIAMVFISYGLWYAQEMPGEEGPQKFAENLEGLFDALKDHTAERFGTAMLSPVMQPYVAKLDDHRKKGLTKARVDLLNKALNKQFSHSTVYVPNVFNDLTEYRPEYFDWVGIHVTKELADLQADILYNIRCNNVISDHFPYANTCCLDYKPPSGLYFLINAVLLFAIPAFIVVHYALKLNSAPNPHANPLKVQLHAALFAMSLGLAYCFLADRTQYFSKGNKNYLTSEFQFLSIVSLIAGALSVTRSDDAKSTGFLNRHMTDEWKGWMQIAILIYHITGASKVLDIYKVIRVMVASYLFMTGYGHTAFFTGKGDFGLKRVLSVLCRINLLTVFLAYVMNTNYIFYYFSPLVTFWFGIIWITFRILPEFNASVKGSLVKTVISGVLVYLFVKMDGPMDAIFWVLKTFARIDWDLREWRFRVLLDIWAVHFGMVVSIFANNKALADLRESLAKFRGLGAVFGLVLIALYWHLASSYTVKAEYNAHNNYLALLAIAGYILVRNGASFLMNRHSRVFGWFGKISLETFILQFHIWMAADTKGVLYILDMGLGGATIAERDAGYATNHILNFLLTTTIFLLVSEKIANASGTLTTLIVSPEKFLSSPEPKTGAAQTTEEIELLESGSRPDGDEESQLPKTSTAAPSTARRLGGKLGQVFGHLFLNMNFRIGFILVALFICNLLW